MVQGLLCASHSYRHKTSRSLSSGLSPWGEKDNNRETKKIMADGGKALKNKQVMVKRVLGQIKEAFFEEVTFNLRS